MNNFNLFLISSIVSISSFSSLGQVGGNQVYGNSNYQSQYNYRQVAKQQAIRSTDSTLIITSSILLNKVADKYLVTVGINQEAKTVVECNKTINQRINSLKKSLKYLNVEEEDVYIDFISQTKIYDYDFDEKIAHQYQKGFEIKKNIVIQLSDIEKIDKLIELCAVEEIYDIIKVEYVDENIESNYQKLYDEAVKILEDRKQIFIKSSDQKISQKFRVIGDNFHAVYPKSQYKQYQAFETSQLQVHSQKYSDTYFRKEKRKQTTFYYDGIETTTFDKIINAATPKVGIQYVYTVSVIYDIEKQ